MSARAYVVQSAGLRPRARRFDWDEARQLRASGLSYSAIAKRLGVSSQSVRLACDDTARVRERGAPAGQPVELQGVLERIAEFFVFAPDGCWHWTGSRVHNGYGLFWIGGSNVRAHRAMYELMVGPIPAGLDLDHLCRVRHCVNPEHLEPVTRAENLRRAREAAAAPVSADTVPRPGGSCSGA